MDTRPNDFGLFLFFYTLINKKLLQSQLSRPRTFMIDPKLLNDSEFIAELQLSQLRLLKDGELDWFLLIPLKASGNDIAEVTAFTEWTDLGLVDQLQLTKEIDFVTRLLKDHVSPDKINIASIGNVVSQLHVHIIARYKTDRAWPGTIWGTQSRQKLDIKRISYWQDIVTQGNLIQ